MVKLQTDETKRKNEEYFKRWDNKISGNNEIANRSIGALNPYNLILFFIILEIVSKIIEWLAISL